MARSKWIFAAQHALNREGQKAAQSSATNTAPLPQPPEVKKFGLENYGNTCYANSVLQALYFCTPFRDLMLQAPDPSVTDDITHIPVASSSNASAHKSQARHQKPHSSALTTGTASSSTSKLPAAPIPPSPPSLFSALRSLFINMSTQPGDKGTVAPKAFIDKLKELNDIFRSTMHQDAHEFLNYLLNRIVEEMEMDRRHAQLSIPGEDLSNSIATIGSTVPSMSTSSTSGTNARDATLVHRLFEGILTSETRCLTCETVSSRDESFLDLSIDIEQNSSVTACLRQFSASEMLCNRNKFFCDSCCDLQEAEKRMKIKKLPNVLALHLKRFKYQEDVGRYIKLTYRVAFPMDLRLFNTVDDMEDADRLYELFAIVVHIGSGPHHGHYISIIKNGGTWLVFDDDNVSSIPESDIPKYFGDSNAGSAYVLYYQAADIDLAAVGVRQPEPETAPVKDTVPVEIPYVQSSSSVAKDLDTTPPGLEDYNRIPEEPELEPPVIPLPHTPHTESHNVLPSPINVMVTPDPVDHSLLSQPPVGSTPATRFGSKVFKSMRTVPSMSAVRGNASATASTSTTDSRLDRSPRLTTSSPAMNGQDDRALQMPPPAPPLPPHANVPPLVPLVTNGHEEKEKPKKGRWFTKRKSMLMGPDKTKSPSPAIDIPGAPSASPSHRADETLTASPSHWFRGFGHRDSNHHSENGKSKDRLSENGHLTYPTPRNGQSSAAGLYPDDIPSTPASTSSSLNSAAHGLIPPSVRPSATAPPSSSYVPRFEPNRRSSHSRLSSPPPPHPVRQRPLSTAQYSGYTGNFDHTLPPLPDTPSSPNSPAFGNGHKVFSEPEANVPHQLQRAATDYPIISPTPHSTSFPAINGVRSNDPITTRPPPPASSAGSNAVHATTSSLPHERKARRKLSLTAPMLGLSRSKDRR